jgi:SAM-dependent methyltransferase
MSRIVSLIRERIVREFDPNYSDYVFDGKEKRYRPARFFLGLFSKKTLDKEFKEIFVKQKEGTELLDVGGGTGLLSGVLLKYFSRVYAIEVSIRMLLESHPRLSLDPNYFRINADIFKSPFKENKTFDAIFCSDVIHHTGRHPELLNILKNLLKDSGTLVIVDYLPESLKTKRVQLFEELFIEDLKLIAPEVLETYFSKDEFSTRYHPISRFEYIFIAQKKQAPICEAKAHLS